MFIMNKPGPFASGILSFLLAAIWLLSCNMPQESPLEWQELTVLPEAVSNNAIASVTVNDTAYIYSFMGLGGGKTYRDIHSKAFKYNVNLVTWTRLEDVPGDSGRLAATAAAAGGYIFIFGGYTVAEDGSEKSDPNVYRLDPMTDAYQKVGEMPVPVDDAVSLVYRNRYIYLISGWHNTGNVEHVQVFDTQTYRWQQATPFPGPPVFGHAGGISGNMMIITDGVKVVHDDGSRKFVMSEESWKGTIRNDSLTDIRWKRIPGHPGPARYRMAATGDPEKIVFAGGTMNPYNYNGIGYDENPSNPDSTLFVYRFQDDNWKVSGHATVPTMDHRSLIKIDEWYYLVGGMHQNQQVSNKVYRFKWNDNPGN